ncbi:hypothetical protein ACFQH5_03185 [Halomonas salifodinae]|uniref:Uncharacterized protein n=1 Tax=Halomonas salifodinae TaxID=438745 RepID=A0ABW2ERG6_9GAMM
MVKEFPTGWRDKRPVCDAGRPRRSLGLWLAGVISAHAPLLLLVLDNGLMQADGIRPYAETRPVILDNVWPARKPLLADAWPATPPNGGDQ